MVNTDYFSRHSKWMYGFEGNEDPAKRGKFPNPLYDPNVKPNKKPKWCKGHVCGACLEAPGGGLVACPHLAYAEISPELRKRLLVVVHQYFEEGSGDDD